MEMNFEKTTISSVTVPTDVVKNSIIWHCLYVLQTMSEFRNLTYRVTKTWNDLEMVVVYREGVLGIFGPPVDPITLMLDQKGKCLLSIPFKPVQRVSIVSPESGHVEISSLLAVLRMIAGNGYLFCPGLPERFLMGKACAKFVVLHKVPFKRYQSPSCPVYYKAQIHQQKSAKSSLCALCPRCMQAAKWVQSLPVIGPNGAGNTAQLTIAGHLQPDRKNVVPGSSSSNCAITQEVNGCNTIPIASARIIPLPDFNSSSATSLPVGPQYLNIPLNNNNMHDHKTSNLDVNGNSQTVDALKDSRYILDQNAKAEDIKPSGNTKMLERMSLLRNVLQKRSMNKMSSSDHCTDNKDSKTSNEDASKQFNNNKLTKLKQRQKNICRHCRKEFSTRANLMNHLQRHEALSGSWCKQFKKRKLLRNHARSSSFPKIVFRGSKLSTFLQGKKPVHLSETSIRLFLKYLDDMILSHNGTKSLKQQGYAASEYKNVSNEAEEQVEWKYERPQSFNFEKTENEALEKRYDLKRTLSGLSPMQTLLNAAVFAEDDNHLTSPTISSSSSLVSAKHEIAVVSSTTHSPTNHPELIEANIPKKKSRKSLRLEYKKSKSNNKKAEDIHNEIAAMKNEDTSKSCPLLTNLNLLSAVSSIKPAIRETQASTHNSLTVSYSIPTSFSSNFYASAANLPTSDSASNHQKLLNTSQNTFKITGSQRNEPFVTTNLSSCKDPSFLPPLFEEASPVYHIYTQKQQGQAQLISPTSSLLTTTVGNNQSTSASLIMTAKMEEIPSNGCGAIDLSKPKPSQTTASTLLSIENKPNLVAFPGLPHDIAQLVTSNKPAVLQYLMMMTKPAVFSNQGFKESQPVNAVTSNKQADSNVQSRLFALAQNYKIDKGAKNAAQVQSVIATSSGLSMQGNVKSGGGSASQSDEIQCGYKWTGSGGLVKERTQMIRELVPSHVMANFLSKPWTPATVSQPISVNLSNNSHLPSPQPVLSFKIEQPSTAKPQDMSTSLHALNLTMSKPAAGQVLNKGLPGIPQKPASSVVTSPSSQVYNSTRISPVSTGINSPKPAISNSFGIVSQHAQTFPAPTDVRSHSTTNSLQKLRHKAIHLPESSSHSSSLLPTATTTSSSCTISSPSLAAMLLQPALTKHKIGYSDTPSHIYHTVTSPKLLKNENSPVDGYGPSSPASNSVKTEPLDSSHIPEQNVTLMTLHSKDERWDPDIESAASPDYDRSPSNLVVDISPESLTNKDKAINLGAHPISRAADFVSKNSSVKCDH